MRIFLYLIIGSIVLNTILCQNLDCSSHPALSGLQRVILEQKKWNSALYQQLSISLTDLTNQSATKTKDNMGICSQYQGQTSCCTSLLEEQLKQLAFSKYEELKTNKSFYGQVLSNIGFSINQCGAQSENISNDFESINTGLKEVEIFKSKYKTCQIQIIQSTVRFYRGQVCSICAGLDNISSYFTGTQQPLLDQSSFTQYYTDLISSMNCMDGLRSEFPDIVNQIFAAYSDQSEQCNNIQAIYQKMLTDNLNYPCQGQACEDSCSNLYFLGASYNCEVNAFVPNNIQDQIYQIQQKGYYNRPQSSNSQTSSRLLMNIKKSNFITSSSGIKSYLADTTQDVLILIDGSVYLNSNILNYSLLITLLIILMTL